MANQITKVYLLNVPLESDLKNTLYFANASSQQTYFQSRIQKSYTDFSYQRKDQFIRVPAQFDTLANCNYVMYQNSAYSNKWFYAFITKMEYVDDGRTDVYIETDVMQTYMFDITVKASFVEREHVDNDTVGRHTVPENVELGEYIISATTQAFVYNSVYTYIAIGVTEVLDSLNEPSAYNEVLPNGLYYIGVRNNKALKTIIKLYDQAGKGDAITAVFVVPQECFPPNGWGPIPQAPDQQYSVTPSYFFSTSENIPMIDYLGTNYEPRNKKLLTFPYRFLQASNNAGGIATYKYEDFAIRTENDQQYMEFDFRFCLTPGGNCRIFPIAYKGKNQNYDEGITLGKLPIGSWTTDVYTNWLTQNGVNIAVGFGANIAQIIGGVAGVASGGGAGLGVASIASGISGIASSVGQVYEHSMQPPQAEGNINNGDVNFIYSLTGIVFNAMSIKPEYAYIIDGYFDMFGYKVNSVKVPNKAHRQRWWYTKTIDVNIDGAVPNEDMQKIKNAYNTGITFWRNASEIQNYSLSNDIV
ncbi:MAG: hypothetical protein IJH63_04490 [Methanobrevibacter sp.]|nr:hypothetical protein [Methanobrevibacter sp.]